jgi:hypothetical protein
MDWREECRRVHIEGMGQLVQDGRIPFRLKVYNSLGVNHPPDLVLKDGVDDSVRELLRTHVFAMFHSVALPAALYQSDTWQVDGQKITTYFGLSETLSFEEYEKEYIRILNEKFEGTAANLPPELMTEGIYTGIKGPQIMPVSFITPYVRDKDGALEFKDTKEVEGGISNLLPDWWETPVN